MPGAVLLVLPEDVAREVFHALNSIEYHDWVPLGAAVEELTLKVRKPSAKMLKRARKVIAVTDIYINGSPLLDNLVRNI